MNRPNLFLEDTDFNICLSWLCDSTDGQTYSISAHFAKKMKRPENMSETEWRYKTEDFFISPVWEDTIGRKHDYKIDDPKALEAARQMAHGLNALIERVNADPDYRRWDSSGSWYMECLLKGQIHFAFVYYGLKSVACRYCADLVITELGDGDGENGGKGSLKNRVDEIADILYTGGRYKYADCIFNFYEKEV